jgi:hypothetical protein
MTATPLARARPTALIYPSDADRLAALARDGTLCAGRAAYLAELLALGPRPLVEAAELERFVVVLGNKLIPALVNDGDERRCCLVSPDVHYVQYMKFELQKMRDNLSARLLALATELMGRLCAPLGFNRCVSLNNWLLTTSPDLPLDADALARLRDLVCARYPDHALVLRNVDARAPARRRAFAAAGWRLVINRPVHEWSPHKLRRATRHNVKAELRLLSSPHVSIADPARLAPGDEHRIADLYRQLYVEKHSVFNPHYTARFFRVAHDTGLLRFSTIAVEGRIMAFSTSYDDGDRLVAALVGYDTKIDRRRYPLYRMLVAALMKRATEQRCTLFLSTGAAAFKRSRGSYEWFEHEAIYDAHLPPARRIPWALFGTALRLGARHLDTKQI